MKHFILSGLLLLSALPAYSLEIKLDGGDAKSNEVVKSTLAYRRLTALKTADGSLFWMRRLTRDGQINLQALGYYESRVESSLNTDKKSILVKLRLGAPVKVSQISIDLPPAALTQVKFPLKPGDQLDHSLYEQGKQSLHAWLLANGYLNARLLTHRLEVDRQNKTASIKLAWNSGPQYKFGPVTFEENKLSPDFLERYIPFSDGDTFSEVLLQQFSDQLRSSGYFSSVDIVPLLDEADELRVPIQVRLQPLKRSVYELGLSLGTDQGAGLEADITRRRANSKGHNWKLQSEWTTQRYLVGGRYEMPSKRHLDRVSRIDLTYIDEVTDTSDRATIKGTLSKQRQFQKWLRIDSLSLLDETFTIAGVSESSGYLILGTDLTRTKATDTINPGKGWRARVTLSGASDALVSATNFVRTEFDYKHIGSFGDKNRWLLRSRVGALWVDDFNELPSSLRFYAGGDRSVRGFDFEALGPTDADNNVLGGQYVATGSLELDRLILPRWRIAIFVDAGNAFGTGRESIEYSTGAGLRWLSPIGPVRLDFANALSVPDNPWRIHFSIGPDL